MLKAHGLGAAVKGCFSTPPQAVLQQVAEQDAHFLDSSRPAAFSKWEHVMMQPPWETSTMGR